jgi:hypothetical protein
MKLNNLIVGLCLFVGVTSCRFDDDNIFGCRQASGPIIEDSFFMGEFDGIKVNKEEHVIITQGPIFSVVVEAPASIMEIVDLDNRNGTLELNYDECVQDSETVTLFVTMPVVDCIDVRGNAVVSSSNILSGNKLRLESGGNCLIDLGLDYEEMDLRIRGSSEVLLEGVCEDLDVRISGDGRVEAFGLLTAFTEVDISGDGELFITVLEYLDVEISGSGEVYFKGNPFIDSDISGSGALIDAN